MTALTMSEANIVHRKIAIGQPQTTGFHFDVPLRMSETASAMSSPVMSTRYGSRAKPTSIGSAYRRIGMNMMTAASTNSIVVQLKNWRRKTNSPATTSSTPPTMSGSRKMHGQDHRGTHRHGDQDVDRDVGRPALVRRRPHVGLRFDHEVSSGTLRLRSP